MQEQIKALDEVVRQLSLEQQREVRDFAEFLLSKQPPRQRRRPRFAWAGVLVEMRDQYTSVDLQHEIAKWRLTMNETLKVLQ
jgi:hypothetical protein